MATYEEFTIDQGTDVAIELHLQDENGNVKNLTNHSLSADLKKTYASQSSVSFNAVVSQPATEGIAVLSLTNAQTSALAKGRYVYDVELSFVDSDGNTIIERILEGRVQVTPEVTGTGGGQ